MHREHSDERDPPEEPADRLGALVRRILASSVTTEQRLEQFFGERRRELDEHTARLEETVADLERRHELLRDARASVERLLRIGTSDLDARESDLARLVRELEEREALLCEEEGELARRRSQLGAVELKRAAIDQRERAIEAQEAQVSAREAQLEERESAVGSDAEEGAHTPSPLLLFVPGQTYRLVEIERAPLRRGDAVELDGIEYIVARTGPSPLPGDVRRCAYLG
jgi:septal ring factor EnvC (AmiA/AmiB activator)